MPPHCDTLDGPVVAAARSSLEKEDVELVLPFAPKTAEREIRDAFRRALRVRGKGTEAKELADLWFFETVVRLHRAGEGAPYTGLKPAGLDWGPVIPRAEKAIERGDASEVTDFLGRAVARAVSERFERAMELKGHAREGVDEERAYTSAMLGFELYSHHLYAGIVGEGKDEERTKPEHAH